MTRILHIEGREIELDACPECPMWRFRGQEDRMRCVLLDKYLPPFGPSFPPDCPLKEKGTHEVYSRPECIFNYCPHPEVCQKRGCQSLRAKEQKEERHGT